MTYLQTSAVRRLAAAALLLVLAHCAEWFGLLSISAHLLEGVKSATLRAYQLSASESFVIDTLYSLQAVWLSIVGSALLVYGIVAGVLLACAVRFAPPRFAGFAAIGLLVATFGFDAPYRLGTAVVDRASDGREVMAISGQDSTRGAYLSPLTPLLTDWPVFRDDGVSRKQWMGGRPIGNIAFLSTLAVVFVCLMLLAAGVRRRVTTL
jgi:hypothetical protein